MKNLKKIFFLLNSSERLNVYFLLVLTIVMALFDTLGIASILPFVAVLTNTDLIYSNLLLNKFFKTLSLIGVETESDFLFTLGILTFLLLIFSLIFKALVTYKLINFVQMCEYTIGKRLIRGYLTKPYHWFLDQNSADLGKNILSEVHAIISTGMRPLMEIISKGLVTIAITVLLFLTDPKLALIVCFSFSFIYLIIFYVLRAYLDEAGKKRFKSNSLRFTTINEVFSAVKEVKVRGLEKNFINNFSNAAKIYAETNSLLQVIAQLPRFMLEAFSFGGILLIILYMMKDTNTFTNTLPILSLYIFAGYRLLPAFQQIYASFTSLTFINSSLNKLFDDSKKFKIIKYSKKTKVLDFKKSISLKKIHFNYPNSKKKILKNVSLTIPSKSTVGFIGKTGSGKTTIIDIILGLLEPQKGSILVDGKLIKKNNLKSWQKIIGYVPQNIFLSDQSVSANIAFGLDHNEIDQDKVEKAAKIAQIHDFVLNELPAKYNTEIGERGIRLSGGQRQRIGIARALYLDPKLLILDEGTNALDIKTEKQVMNSLNNLGKDVTVIIITHRLKTLKNCKVVFKLDKGHLISQKNILNEFKKKF